MKTIDQVIRERRSVRSYLDKAVEPEKITALLEAARLAPSACNAQPWRFIAVTDPTIKRRIEAEGLGGVVPNTWAKTAPVMIVVCSDLSFFTHRVAEKVQGVEYHLMDLGMAMEHLVLKAVDLDLGTCYIGWFNAKPIKKILDLPASCKVECLITLGYPADLPNHSNPSPRKELKDIAVIR